MEIFDITNCDIKNLSSCRVLQVEEADGDYQIKAEPFLLLTLEKPTIADDDIRYGLPSRETEMKEISQGVDMSTLLDLVEKGEV